MISQLNPTVVLAGCQILLDIVLLASIIILYRRLRTLNPENLGVLFDALKQSEKLCADLGENIREKDRLVRELTSSLESLSPKGTGPGDRGQVSSGQGRQTILQLWKHGKSVAEIAAETGIARGEVEVVISLAKASDTQRN